MTLPSDLYETKIISLADLFSGEGFKTDAGIIVPDYQREYNWDTDMVKRLYTTILTGFGKGSDNHRSELEPTFLGSFIFCVDNTNPTFKGDEFDLIDGQQRLTTLCLLACALIVQMRESLTFITDASELTKAEQDALYELLEEVQHDLSILLIGQTMTRKSEPFPRIVRNIDSRDNSITLTTAKSPICKFIIEAFNYYNSTTSIMDLTDLETSDGNGARLVECFRLIQSELQKVGDGEYYSSIEAKFVTSDQLSSRKYIELLSTIPNATMAQQIVQKCVRNKDLAHVIRTLMLGQYFQNYIGLNWIYCKSVETAFDIFDSLNSTGLPLTAIETFRPQVLNDYKHARESFEGSVADAAFQNIDDIFANYSSSRQQDESRKIVSSTIYYLTGEKVVEKLFEQRRMLRTMQSEFTVKKALSEVPDALATIAQFRDIFFTPKADHMDGISGELFGLNTEQVANIKLNCFLLSSSKTILTVPTLARAWSYGVKIKNHEYFYKVLRSIVAFFVLRRFASGSTDGIDTKFRDLVNGKEAYRGFTVKKVTDENLPTIDEINSFLIESLKTKSFRFDLSMKDAWVKRVARVPIYSHSRPLTKFLIHAAHNFTSLNAEGLPTRDHTVKSSDRNFLTWNEWNQKIYETIEHVAPQQGIPAEWPGVYDDPTLRNTLGNFILLPQVQNSHIGNASWHKKKIFMNILTSADVRHRQDGINTAKTSGIRFNKKLEDELRDASRSSMLDGVDLVPIWNAEHIIKRSEIMASLCWDHFVEDLRVRART